MISKFLEPIYSSEIEAYTNKKLNLYDQMLLRHCLSRLQSSIQNKFTAFIDRETSAITWQSPDIDPIIEEILDERSEIHPIDYDMTNSIYHHTQDIQPYERRERVVLDFLQSG